MSLLGPETTVISLHDILQATRSSQMDQWGQFVADEIQRIRPESIVAHNFGGTMALKALLKLQEQKKPLLARLTLLSCAFRDFDVLKNTHPFLMQLAPWPVIVRKIIASGGHVDPALRPWMGTIRDVYRQVIVGSVARKIQNKLYTGDKARQDSLDIDLGIPSQIIASSHDPYISMHCLHRIQDDFLIENFHVVDYGHFPYTSERGGVVRQLIHHFEESPRALHA